MEIPETVEGHLTGWYHLRIQLGRSPTLARACRGMAFAVPQQPVVPWQHTCVDGLTLSARCPSHPSESWDPSDPPPVIPASPSRPTIPQSSHRPPHQSSHHPPVIPPKAGTQRPLPRRPSERRNPVVPPAQSSQRPLSPVIPASPQSSQRKLGPRVAGELGFCRAHTRQDMYTIVSFRDPPPNSICVDPVASPSRPSDPAPQSSQHPPSRPVIPASPRHPSESWDPVAPLPSRPSIPPSSQRKLGPSGPSPQSSQHAPSHPTVPQSSQRKLGPRVVGNRGSFETTQVRTCTSSLGGGFG